MLIDKLEWKLTCGSNYEIVAEFDRKDRPNVDGKVEYDYWTITISANKQVKDFFDFGVDAGEVPKFEHILMHWQSRVADAVVMLTAESFYKERREELNNLLVKVERVHFTNSVKSTETSILLTEGQIKELYCISSSYVRTKGNKEFYKFTFNYDRSLIVAILPKTLIPPYLLNSI